VLKTSRSLADHLTTFPLQNIQFKLLTEGELDVDARLQLSALAEESWVETQQCDCAQL